MLGRSRRKVVAECFDCSVGGDKQREDVEALWAGGRGEPRVGPGGGAHSFGYLWASPVHAVYQHFAVFGECRAVSK